MTWKNLRKKMVSFSYRKKKSLSDGRNAGEGDLEEVSDMFKNLVANSITTKPKVVPAKHKPTSPAKPKPKPKVVPTSKPSVATSSPPLNDSWGEFDDKPSQPPPHISDSTIPTVSSSKDERAAQMAKMKEERKLRMAQLKQKRLASAAET